MNLKQLTFIFTASTGVAATAFTDSVEDVGTLGGLTQPSGCGCIVGVSYVLRSSLNYTSMPCFLE
jgi:hypothetical protein